MANTHPTWTPGQPLTDANVTFSGDPGKIVADYFDKGSQTLASIDDRQLIDAKTGQPVILDGVFSRDQAETKIMHSRQAAEQAVRAQFETARQNVRKSIAKPMPEGVREQIATMKQIGASPTEVEALQNTYRDSYLAQRLIQSELMDDSTPGTRIMAPPVDDVLGQLDHTEALTLKALNTHPGQANDNYTALLIAKGEVTKSAMHGAQFFSETFGSDK